MHTSQNNTQGFLIGMGMIKMCQGENKTTIHACNGELSAIVIPLLGNLPHCGSHPAIVGIFPAEYDKYIFLSSGWPAILSVHRAVY